MMGPICQLCGCVEFKKDSYGDLCCKECERDLGEWTERQAANERVVKAAFDMVYNSKFIKDTDKINAIFHAVRNHPDYDENKEPE